MRLELIDFNNYKTGISVQKEIFPTEDGTLNILTSLDKNLFIKTTGILYVDYDPKYYLVYNNDEIIGITGLYCEKLVCLESAWVGWFGVLKKFRGQGYGEKILNMTIELAKKEGYKTIRLYTDIKENKTAVKLYEKMGFIGEKYNAEKLIYDSYIFSKSLTEKQTELWKDKKLNLSYQTELDQMDETKIKEIFNKYENLDNQKI